MMINSVNYGSAEQLRPQFNTAPLKLSSWIIFLIVFSGMVHNFAGVFAALLFACFYGPLRRGAIPLTGLCGTFVAIAAFSLGRAFVPGFTGIATQFEEPVRYLSYALFASCLLTLPRETMVKAMAVVMLFSLALYPIFVVTGQFGVMDASGNERFAAYMPHANHLGYSATAIAITGIYVYLSGARIPFLGPMILAGIANVLLSESSGAFLVLTAGLMTLPLSQRSVVSGIALFLGILVVGSVVLFSTSFGISAIEKILAVDFYTVARRAESFTFGNQGSSFAWRLSYWRAMISAQIDAGYIAVLLGQGGGAGAQDAGLYFFMGKDPHSDFVKVFLEFGLIGVAIVFGALMLHILRRSNRLVRAIVLFGPMATANSLASPVVMFIIIICLFVLVSPQSRKSQ